MPVGTPLYAARAGLVAYVAYGIMAVKVGAALYDWYIHIDSNVAVVGQTVGEGQLVAYSGDKAPAGGASSGPHLHFEVQAQTYAVCNIPATSLDPVPVLEGALNATDVKGIAIVAIHGTGQEFLYTQADLDKMAADYAAGKPLDAITAGIVNTPAGLAYKASVAALIKAGPAKDGAPGVSVVATALPVGDANCSYGGVKLVAASGTTYVCNGAPGKDGVIPPGTPIVIDLTGKTA